MEETGKRKVGRENMRRRKPCFGTQSKRQTCKLRQPATVSQLAWGRRLEGSRRSACCTLPAVVTAANGEDAVTHPLNLVFI